jgi:hypothetical protein
MFPTIPRSYIVRELDRADGVVQVAVDNLILMSSDFSGSTSDISVCSPFVDNKKFLKKLDDEDSTGNEAGDEMAKRKEVVLTKKNWDSVESGTRQRILHNKKRDMIMKARENYMKQEEN